MAKSHVFIEGYEMHHIGDYCLIISSEEIL